MPTAEVMKRLNAAGIAVKATASAVDEVEADAALTGKKKPSANGAKPKQPPRPQLRPPGDLGIRDLGARPPEGVKPTQDEPARAARRDERQGRRRQGRPAPADALLAAGRARPRRVRRRAPRRHRLAGRAPPRRSRRPRRPGRRSRRRPAAAPAAARRPAPARHLPGAGAAGRLASCRPTSSRSTPARPSRTSPSTSASPVPEIIKKLMQLGEMATLTQTLSDDAIQVLADEFDKKIEIVHAADEVDAEPEFDDADEDLVDAPAGRHDHGPRRPRQDVAARRDPRDRGRRRRGRRHHPAHRRLPGPPRRRRRITFLDTPGPRGVHRHARPRRAGHRHRGDRGRRRRRREAADARGGRPRQGGRRADPRRGQQDRQGGRAARPRAHRDDEARPAAGGVGRRDDVRRRLGQDQDEPRRPARDDPARWPRSRSSRPTRTPRRPASSSSPSSTRAAAPSSRCSSSAAR